MPTTAAPPFEIFNFFNEIVNFWQVFATFIVQSNTLWKCNVYKFINSTYFIKYLQSTVSSNFFFFLLKVNHWNSSPALCQTRFGNYSFFNTFKSFMKRLTRTYIKLWLTKLQMFILFPRPKEKTSTKLKFFFHLLKINFKKILKTKFFHLSFAIWLHFIIKTTIE